MYVVPYKIKMSPIALTSMAYGTSQHVIAVVVKNPSSHSGLSLSLGKGSCLMRNQL